MGAQGAEAPLLKDFEAGGEYVVIAPATMRQEESLGSALMTELRRGERVTIKEVGIENRRRVKVEQLALGKREGWISVQRQDGTFTLGKVPAFILERFCPAEGISEPEGADVQGNAEVQAPALSWTRTRGQASPWLALTETAEEWRHRDALSDERWFLAHSQHQGTQNRWERCRRRSDRRWTLP